MDLIYYIVAGAGVGLAIGLTGVGGGSLMTPLLLLFGFPPATAVGTDLLYAAITKSGGVAMHYRQGTINWRVVSAMLLGSLPASVATSFFLHRYFDANEQYTHLLTTSLGIMLILTSIVLLFKDKLLSPSIDDSPKFLKSARERSLQWTFFAGLILGVFVTLSSVGAGAFGTAVLLLLFPRLPSINIIGTDLSHAVPLTLVAGFGHLLLGNVDFLLLGSLLIGSLPAIYIGTKLGAKLPDNILQPVLASALLALGVKYAFF